AVGVDGKPIEDAGVELGTPTAFGNLRLGAAGVMAEDGIGVNAAFIAADGEADFEVNAAAAAFDGDFGAICAVGFRVDGDAGDGVRGRLFPVAGRVTGTVAEGLDGLIDERGEVAAAFVDLG